MLQGRRKELSIQWILIKGREGKENKTDNMDSDDLGEEMEEKQRLNFFCKGEHILIIYLVLSW